MMQMTPNSNSDTARLSKILNQMMLLQRGKGVDTVRIIRAFWLDLSVCLVSLSPHNNIPNANINLTSVNSLTDFVDIIVHAHCDNAKCEIDGKLAKAVIAFAIYAVTGLLLVYKGQVSNLL